MDSMEEMVLEFQTKFETSKDPELWVKLVKEELDEVREALANLIKEYCDFAYVSQGLLNEVGEEEGMRLLEGADLNPSGILNDVLGEIPPKVLGEAFRRVHASNMSKLGDDGKPVRREDGKVMKGPNYKPPILDDLIV